MIDHRPTMPMAPWQVTIRRDGHIEKHNVYADSLHEARMIGSRISPMPNTVPSNVIDVCLLEIAKARKEATFQALDQHFRRKGADKKTVGFVFIPNDGWASVKELFIGDV